MYDLGRRDGKENGKEGVLVLGPMEAYLGYWAGLSCGLWEGGGRGVWL
jgi:hypothetical protein